MPIDLARVIVAAGAGYLAVGIVLLPWWLARGLNRLDAAAGSASWKVKFLFIPGLLLLWPLLVVRGLTGNGHPPAERNAHRRAATEGPRGSS